MKEIVVDLYGGDNGIEDTIDGVVRAVSKDDNLAVILPVLEKDKSKVSSLIEKKVEQDTRIIMIDAESVLGGEDNPVKAATGGAGYTITKSIEYLKEHQDVSLVTVGNTAATLILALSKVGLKSGVKKPVLAALLPRYTGDMFCLLDCGANLKVTSEELVDFSKLGAECIEKTFKKNNAKVGLLSVGAEDRKGTDIIIKANELLRNDNTVNFIGNVEPDMIFESDVDVVVCDGFAGNMILKNTEASGNYFRGVYNKIKQKNSLKSQNHTDEKSETDSIDIKIWDEMEHYYRFNDYGGAVFLGINCNIIKAHGKANADTIYNCINLAKKM